MEKKNLGRILAASMADARQQALKVDVMKRWIEKSGMKSIVEVIPENVISPKAIRFVAQCDVAIGCMDGVEGRHLLNRLTAFYLIPYIDVGVKLEADGNGGVNQICGTIHYLKPDGSSLLSRGLYTHDQVQAEALKRTNPRAYKEQVQSKYIKGVQEDRPAVISVNMHFASMAVNELLARLHPYRDDDNSDYAIYRMSLTQGQIYKEADGEPCNALKKYVGRGDTVPLLGRPDLSEDSLC
jgi:hypothetical protein